MIEFFKMHGIGNDFILIDNLDGRIYQIINNISEFSQKLCQRRLGIGADGLILLDKSHKADFKMRIFNSDGSEALMCGNGIRCAAVLYQKLKNKNKDTFRVETLSGIKEVSLFKKEGKIWASVVMGKPDFSPENIPINLEKTPFFEKVKLKEGNITISCVSMGNPHCVIMVEDNPQLKLEKEENWLLWGNIIEKNPLFPDRTNVEFVKKINDNVYQVKVWERGAGHTLGCGTGACAVFSILNKKNGIGKIQISMEGGNLEVSLLNDGQILLVGEIEEVFRGKLN